MLVERNADSSIYEMGLDAENPINVTIPFTELGCTSGLLVKVLACNQKVAVSSPTRCRHFSPMSILSSTLKMRRCSSPHPSEGM